MGQFQDFIEQDPARKARMDGFVKAAQTMAKGGMVRKMANGGAIGTGGLAANGGFQQNYQSAPMYDQFKQSDYYKDMPSIGATVTGGATIDDKTYNFPMAMEADAYKDYMRSLGGYQVGARPQAPGGETPIGGGMFPGMEASVPPMYGPEGTYSLTGRPAPGGGTFQAPLQAQPVASSAAVLRLPTDTDESYAAKVRQNEEFERRFQNSQMKGTTSQQPSSSPQQIQLPQQSVPTYTTPPPTVTTVTQYQDDDGNVYASETDVPEGVTTTPIQVTQTKQPTIGDIMVQQAFTPGLPTGGAVAAVGTQATPDQMIDPYTGQVADGMAVPTTLAQTTQAIPAVEGNAAQVQATTAAPAIASAIDATQAAQGVVDPRAEVIAAQQTASSVGNVSAAQGNSILIDNPVQRQIQSGELISGVADAQTAATFTEQIQSATATPSQQATVQGQLASLTANFDASNPPAWAAGALRGVQAQMASRGLGASSMAGQAMVQAALESAIPIAQADASVTAQFEAQNLSNRQQRAMLSAQQRATFIGMEFDQEFQSRVQNSAKISDIANMNFTAEQQVQLENSRVANTVNLQNLTNSQAMVMAEASALAQMDASNLNNRQQTAVQNAQSFLNMDMANLSNRQQTDTFKAQQRIQSLFTDQAAENAARQFNATSENQTNQFFANLNSQVSQFNASQSNAQSQFNAGQRNTVERFNAELNNQRDQFNAQNQLVISQNNAQWRREIATANTAAINRANELNATSLLDISKNSYDNLWTYYADTMEWAWTSAENELDRINSMAIAQLSADAQAAATKAAGKTAAGSAIGGLIGTLGSAFIEFCWVAREVYGPSDIRWFIFRSWMKKNAPRWLYKLYVKHGKDFAEYIKDKPKIKFFIRQLMNLVVKKHKVRYNYAN
jgi:hypothetical protein